MPTPLPPARYDAPWKLALTHAFPAFMAFYFPELYPLIDWSQRPRFRDKELAQVGFGDAPDGMVADKLVEVCLRHSKQTVLVHIEVQAQFNANLAPRILDLNFRIFKECGLEVASLVLLADEDPNWRPHSFEVAVLGTKMGISFSTAKLLDFDNRQPVESGNPFALVTRAHLSSQRERHDADALLATKCLLTRQLYELGWSNRRIMVMFKVINWMMALPAPQQARYWHAILKQEKERSMQRYMELVTPLEEWFMDRGWKKGVQHGLEQGLEQGLQKGREEGCRDGAAELLARLLEQRFGPLPKTVQRKLKKADLAQLEAWSDAMLQAQSLKQVFN